jgi:hypothetical protein
MLLFLLKYFGNDFNTAQEFECDTAGTYCPKNHFLNTQCYIPEGFGFGFRWTLFSGEIKSGNDKLLEERVG